MRASKRNEGAGSWDGWEENADDEARVRWEADGSAAQLPPLAARSPQTTGGRSARPTSHALQSLVGLWPVRIRTTAIGAARLFGGLATTPESTRVEDAP